MSKPLTEQEREILWRIQNGHKQKQIASDLQVSVKTVQCHCYNIHRKLKVKKHAFLRIAVQD